jgi:hypothetical protein
MKTQIFHHAKILSSKSPLKETQILQDIIITLELIASFNTSQNIIIFSKIPYATILHNESKHNSLANKLHHLKRYIAILYRQK